MPEPTVHLSPQQIHDYHEQGWIALPAISTPDELAWLRATYDSLFAQRVGRDRGDQFDLVGDDRDPERPVVPQILGLSDYEPRLRETLAWANARRIATQLFGREPENLFDHAILKPPFCPMATPWHQDLAYWDPAFDHQSMSLWMPLQDVDLASGCMHFVPGSHRGEVLRHRSIGGDPAVHGLELDDPPPAALAGAVAVPLAAGGCTVHHQGMLHATTPNQVASPRRAWILTPQLARVRREVPRRFPWEEAKRTRRAARAQAAAAATAAGRA
jgi:hypothetical protein